MTTKYNHIIISNINSLADLKECGTYFFVKNSIEKELGTKLGGRSWKDLYIKITNIKSIVEKEEILLDTSCLDYDFLKARDKLQKILTIKITTKNIEELNILINKLVKFFRKSSLSPYERYEKNKKRNFISSSKLEGIDIPNKTTTDSLEDILKRYREI